MTNYLEVVTLGLTLGQNPTIAAPVTTTLGLYTVTPTDLGSDGTEVVGGSYGRQTVYWSAPITDSSGNTTISNSNLLNFPMATANWGIIVAGAIFGIDSIGVSRMLYYGPIYPVQTINTSDVFQVLQGDLTISID